MPHTLDYTDFDWNPTEQAETATAGDFTVVLRQDSDAVNPFEDREMACRRILWDRCGVRENDSGLGLNNDIAEIYDDREGLSENNLFLYLYDDATIRQEIKDDTPKPLQMEKLRQACCDIITVAADPETRIDEVSAAADQIYDFIDEDSLDDFIQGEMGISSAYAFSDHLTGSEFLEPGSDRYVLEKHLKELLSSLDTVNESTHVSDGNIRRMFSSAAAKAITHIDAFLELHEKTLGGEMLFVKRAKDFFEKEYGARQAAAYAFFDADDRGRGASKTSEMTSNGGVLILHANDANAMLGFHVDVQPGGLVSPNSKEVNDRFQEILDGELEEYLGWLNGETFGYEIIDERTEDSSVVDSCWGFYGNSKRSGIIDAVNQSLDALQRQESQFGPK